MRSHQYRDILAARSTQRSWVFPTTSPMGRVLGATPCGRKTASHRAKACRHLSAPTPRRRWQRCAPPPSSIRRSTAVASLLNLRLDHNLVATKRGQANLGAMVQTLFSLGAFHVQFNCISSEVLRDAQAHPENYKDLLVRVAGYSTQFVNLSKSMQDAIIARTEHSNF